MFKALLLSLNDGQSYKNVEICEHQDFDKFGIKKLFGNPTACFYADKKCTLLHNWSIALIHLNKDHIKNGIYTERLVLEGNLSFSNVTVIEHENLKAYNIPDYFDSDRQCQCTFSCRQGTFITSANGVASMLINNDRHVGITQKILCDKPKIQRRSLQPRIKKHT